MKTIKTILTSAVAIIYAIWPVDVIPDFLIGPGQADDLAVIIGCILYIRHVWKKKKEEY